MLDRVDKTFISKFVQDPPQRNLVGGSVSCGVDEVLIPPSRRLRSEY